MLVDLAANGIHSSFAEPMFLCITVAYINALLACMGSFDGMCAVHTMFLNRRCNCWIHCARHPALSNKLFHMKSKN
jgi:hypothetical protein